jgi:hypothetical protein
MNYNIYNKDLNYKFIKKIQETVKNGFTYQEIGNLNYVTKLCIRLESQNYDDQRNFHWWSCYRVFNDYLMRCNVKKYLHIKFKEKSRKSKRHLFRQRKKHCLV